MSYSPHELVKVIGVTYRKISSDASLRKITCRYDDRVVFYYLEKSTDHVIAKMIAYRDTRRAICFIRKDKYLALGDKKCRKLTLHQLETEKHKLL